MIKLKFTGDLLSTARMNEVAERDYSPIFSLVPELSDCDYLIGNIETPVADSEFGFTDERYRFNTPIEFIKAMKKAGFSLLSLANNHCMDRGEKGILSTLQNCKQEGFDTVGIYASKEDRDKIFIKDFGSLKVAFINYTYGTNAFAHNTFLEHGYMVNLFQPEETKKGSIHLLNSNRQIEKDLKRIYEDGKDLEFSLPYLEKLKGDIERAKKEADFVIMLMHCGGQYNLSVDPYSKFVASKIKGFGADIIIGHHPHIIQESDFSSGCSTIYSLGNFLCDPVDEKDGLSFTDNEFSVVFDLYLDKKEGGEITVKKEFGIYTTVVDEKGLPRVINSKKVADEFDQTRFKMETLRWANIFAGEEKYDEVKEFYGL